MSHRESCAGCREAVGEALTAARVGGVLSTETVDFLSAETVLAVEGNIGHAARDEAWTGSAVSENSRHARTSNIGNWEVVRHEGAQEGASPPCSRAAQEMEDGPPEPPCRRRLQTAHRCCV